MASGDTDLWDRGQACAAPCTRKLRWRRDTEGRKEDQAEDLTVLTMSDLWAVEGKGKPKAMMVQGQRGRNQMWVLKGPML